MGRSPSRTFWRYWPMSRNRRCKPCKDCSWDVIRVDRVPTATSRMSRSRCSTPISSASSASMIDGVCTKVLVVVVPSYEQCVWLAWVSCEDKQAFRPHTSLISSTAKYASVGTPTSFGCTSMITSRGLGVYLLNSSLISRSEALSFGPE